MSYPFITQIMVNSHCEILWGDNPGENLGRYPTENYAEELDDAQKQSIIAHQHLRSKILGLWIKISLTIDVKIKLRDFKFTYTFNAQYDGAAMFFVIVKMVLPNTCTGCSEIKSNLENMNIYHFKHDTPKANRKISECMNDISIDGETYSETVRHKFTV